MRKSKGILIKESKLHEGRPFTYWWDITPSLARRLADYETVEFFCKDTGLRCSVPVEQLKTFLTKDRQTTRAAESWGIKVRKKFGYEDKLAFEPGPGRDKEWLYVPVTWT